MRTRWGPEGGKRWDMSVRHEGCIPRVSRGQRSVQRPVSDHGHLRVRRGLCESRCRPERSEHQGGRRQAQWCSGVKATSWLFAVLLRLR